MSEVDASLPVVEDVAVPPPPPSVGEQLAAARQGRGLEIGDVALTLKLGARQVAALEGGNWQALPGPTFIRGFVRNYARLLGLDPAPLMAVLDNVLDKPMAKLVPLPSRQAPMPQSGGGISRRDRLVVIAGGVLVLLAALAYFLIPGDLSSWRESAQGVLEALTHKSEEPAVAPAEPAFPPGATPQQIMNPQAAPAVEETAPAPARMLAPVATAEATAPIAVASTPVAAPVAAAIAGSLHLAVSKEAWIEVRDRDNRLVFSQRMAAGSEQALSGAVPLTLVIGYAPGVRLTWQGKAVDLAPYSRGDVARLVLE